MRFLGEALSTMISSDDSFVFDFRMVAEVDNHADSEAGCFEIVMHLGAMLVGQGRESLDFKDDSLEQDEVWFVYLNKRMPFVCDLQFGLSLNSMFKHSWYTASRNPHPLSL